MTSNERTVITMMNLSRNENGNVVLPVQNIFVIPNSPDRVEYLIEKGFHWMVRTIEACKKMFELNGWGTLPNDDKMVQIWWTSEFCSDFTSHHPIGILDEKEYEVKLLCDELPLSIIKDWKEGEKHTILIPIKLYPFNKEDESIETIAEVEVEVNQLGYRYKTYGKFEDVIRKIA